MSPREATHRRGRLAPTPTGLLHVGHARTFAEAARRAGTAGLVLRIEDLDPDRCREEFAAAALDDLRWLGLAWTEGPDLGGPHAPYLQSGRGRWYRDIWRRLEAAGAIYPSPHSRKDLQEAGLAPHADGEPIFPPALRPKIRQRAAEPGGVPWRFRVPDGRLIAFNDATAGRVERTAGVDFGDFVIWRRENLAAYELAVTADDHAMEIQEVVRGDDLLTSTARQLLLYETLGWEPPIFCHLPLIRDPHGQRLAKRSASLSIRELRRAGHSPEAVLAGPLSDLPLGGG